MLLKIEGERAKKLLVAENRPQHVKYAGPFFVGVAIHQLLRKSVLAADHRAAVARQILAQVDQVVLEK